jgi:hypothetical protein
VFRNAVRAAGRLYLSGLPAATVWNKKQTINQEI